jgi:hypothetical protein
MNEWLVLFCIISKEFFKEFFEANGSFERHPTLPFAVMCRVPQSLFGVKSSQLLH